MSEITREQVEKIDKILNLLIEGEAQYKNYQIGALSIIKKLGLDYEETRHLLKLLEFSIDFEGNNVVRFQSGDIGSNYNTSRFIKAGGAIAWYERKLAEQMKIKERQTLEELKLKNDLESFRITKKQYRFTKWTAIISGIIALISILLQVFNII